MRREQAASAAPIRPPRPTRALRAKAKTSGAERGLVKVGTRIFEVRRSIGAPNRIIRQSAENGKRLRPPASHRWVYLPVDDDPQVTILTVRNGRVLHVERKGPS